MPERIWKDRCEDCYDKKPISMREGEPFLPNGMSAELCDGCIAKREANLNLGKEPAPIGLLLDGEWRDAGSIYPIVAGQVLTVDVKYLATGEDAGLGCLRFDYEPKWLTAGCFNQSAAAARSSARTFLETYYFPASAPLQYASDPLSHQ